MDGAHPNETLILEIQGDTLSDCLGAEHLDSLKSVRVAYMTSSGETKYRSFIACPSTEDVSSRPERQSEINTSGSMTRTCIPLAQGGEVEHLAGFENMERDQQVKSGSSSGKEFDYTNETSKVKMKAKVSEDSGDVGENGN